MRLNRGRLSLLAAEPSSPLGLRAGRFRPVRCGKSLWGFRLAGDVGVRSDGRIRLGLGVARHGRSSRGDAVPGGIAGRDLRCGGTHFTQHFILLLLHAVASRSCHLEVFWAEWSIELRVHDCEPLELTGLRRRLAFV